MYDSQPTSTAAGKYALAALVAVGSASIGTNFCVQEINSLPLDKDFAQLGRVVPADSVEDRFLALADKWLSDVAFYSSISQKIVHPDYLRIIDMGRPAVPLLLRALTERPGHWFDALSAITGADPITPDIAGNYAQMSSAWLRWGRKRGYVAAYYDVV